jgi:hypothetical protein
MSLNNQNLASQLESILGQLNDDDLASLPEEEVLNMRKKLNPYGRTIEGSDKYINFSMTQIHHEYWKKFIISAFVGYLNRMNDEWKVPEGVPVTPVYEFLDDSTKVDTPPAVLKKAYQPTIDDYEFNREWMNKRLVVKEFLEEMFQFNPDEHVRSGYKPNRSDKSRKPINTPAGKLAVSHLKRTNTDFRAQESLHEAVENNLTNDNTTDNTNDNTKSKTKKVKRTIIGKDGKKKVIMKTVVIDEDVMESNVVDSTLKISDNKDPNLPLNVREMLPPQDTFGRFKMYYTSNLEELREFVRDAYCEKPELELAINPYSVHDTPEDAETFKKKHKNEVIAEVFTAHFGKWNFFDSFKEQREHTNFYSDKTIVLEEIMKQLESDERLGQDLMKKRVEKAKAKNVVQTGPDAESFKKWRDQNNTIKNMGAEHIGDMADDECPDDAVQVDVWRIAKGGLEIVKDKFYSAAEAPTFVQGSDNTANIDKKPSRVDNIQSTTDSVK